MDETHLIPEPQHTQTMHCYRVGKIPYFRLYQTLHAPLLRWTLHPNSWSRPKELNAEEAAKMEEYHQKAIAERVWDTIKTPLLP